MLTAQLFVNHQNATGHFSPWLLDLTFTDHVAGESDGLEVRLDNADGRWMNDWYPVKGTSIEAFFGYEDRPLLGTGVCEVDEIELEGPPSVVTLRAIAAGNRKALRTPRSRAYEGRGLRAIAAEVASTHGLKLVGEVPDIPWRRATQHRETDLAFLCRLGEEHGIVFSVRGEQLVFHDIQRLEELPATLKLTPSDLISYRFRERVVEGAASAAYFDGSTKELRVVEVQTQGHPHPDRRKLRRRTEGPAHSQRLAKVALKTSKGFEREATLVLPGEPRLVAGTTLELGGFGALEGLWLTRSARHGLSRGGYTTELEVRHVAA